MHDRVITIQAVRGAVQVGADTPVMIRIGVRELLAAATEANGLRHDDIVSIMFTSTPDLRSELPALAAQDAGMIEVPLLCAAEIDAPHAMPRVIRLMAHVMTWRPRSEIRHVYLGGARPPMARPPGWA